MSAKKYFFAISLILCGAPSLSLDLLITELYEHILNGIDCGCNRTGGLDVSKVYLEINNYETNNSFTLPLYGSGANIINRSDFNTNQHIVVFVHGFNSDVNGRPQITSKCTFSKMRGNGLGIYSIAVQHYNYTSGQNLLEDINILGAYKKAVKYVQSIGEAVALHLLKDILGETDSNQVHVVGHSLGGHIIGYIGRKLASIGIYLSKLYAADPAGPCYADCPKEHIQKGDAKVTYAFHGNAGEYGSYLNLTDFNFYSHNGVWQLGCKGFGLVGIAKTAYRSSCSHTKTYGITVNPVILSNKWEATQCSDYNKYSNGKCANNATTLAGFTITPTTLPGIYYFEPDEDLVCDSLHQTVKKLNGLYN